MIIKLAKREVDTAVNGWAIGLTEDEYSQCDDALQEEEYNNPAHPTHCCCVSCIREENEQDRLMTIREERLFDKGE